MGYSRRHASAGIGPHGSRGPRSPVEPPSNSDHSTSQLPCESADWDPPRRPVHDRRTCRSSGTTFVFVQWAALTSRVTRLLQLPNRLPWAPSAVGHVAHELASANSRQRVVGGRFACSSGAPPRSRKGSRLRILCPRLWCSSFRGPGFAVRAAWVLGHLFRCQPIAWGGVLVPPQLRVGSHSCPHVAPPGARGSDLGSLKHSKIRSYLHDVLKGGR